MLSQKTMAILIWVVFGISLISLALTLFTKKSIATDAKTGNAQIKTSIGFDNPFAKTKA